MLGIFKKKKPQLPYQLTDKEISLLEQYPEGLTPLDFKRFQEFCGTQKEKSSEHIKSNIINRTFRNRLQDHIKLIKDILKGKCCLNELLDIDDRKLLFIDIGPGIGNKEYPAITSIEMAKAFPDKIDVVAVDLPSSFQILENLLNENSNLKDELRKYKNLYFINDNALQIEKTWFNGRQDAIFTDREIPSLRGRDDRILIIRSANSIDVYCSWDDVRSWLTRIANEFRCYRILFLLHREILYKEQNNTEWTAIGMVSERGFRSGTQDLSLKRGIPIYEIDKKKVQSAILRRKLAYQ